VHGIPQDQVERAARMYHHNADACVALGITLRAFSRLCNRYNIETPYARRRRQLAAAVRRPVAAQLAPA
jgi:hypothetical protein